MDKFEAMTILVAVADCGSLSQASRKLKTPLASVSRKLSELESHLNVKLLTRTTRATELTDYGQSYVSLCRRILDEVEEADRTVTGEYAAPKGVLTITAPIVFGRLHLVPVVAEFLKAYPDVDVQLQLTDSSVDMLEEKLDVSLRIGELPDSSLIAIRVGEIRQVVCGSADYLKQHGKPRDPQDLRSHHCINVTALGGLRKWNFYSGKSKVNVAIQPRLEVSTPEAGVAAAALGVGLVRALSYQVADYKKSKKLEIVLQKFEPKPWPVHLIHSAGRIVPLKLRAFLDFASPRLRKRILSCT